MNYLVEVLLLVDGKEVPFNYNVIADSPLKATLKAINLMDKEYLNSGNKLLKLQVIVPED